MAALVGAASALESLGNAGRMTAAAARLSKLLLFIGGSSGAC
jgi:hypothetical protein